MDGQHTVLLKAKGRKTLQLLIYKKRNSLAFTIKVQNHIPSHTSTSLGRSVRYQVLSYPKCHGGQTMTSSRTMPTKLSLQFCPSSMNLLKVFLSLFSPIPAFVQTVSFQCAETQQSSHNVNDPARQ